MNAEPTDAERADDGTPDRGEVAAEGAEPEAALSVETLLDDLDRVTAERDSYLDDSRRIAAEFANFRRQVEKRNVDILEQANAALVDKLLPTLDAFDAAIAHGATDVEPVFATLLIALEKEGLERVRPVGDDFDPTRHEAVMHEPAEHHAGPVVIEVLRTGYVWKGRVVRPALVKVRG